MKQTLEEAAREAAEDCYEMPYNENLINMRIIKEAFEFGVKWQAKDGTVLVKGMYFKVSELDFFEDFEAIDWEQRRYEIAKETVTAIMSNEDFYHQVLCEGAEHGQRQIQTNIARAAVIFADALIEELKKGD